MKNKNTLLFAILICFNVYSWHLFTVFLIILSVSMILVNIHYANENKTLKTALDAEKLKVSAVNDQLRQMQNDRDYYKKIALNIAGAIEIKDHSNLHGLHQSENKKKPTEKTKV